MLRPHFPPSPRQPSPRRPSTTLKTAGCGLYACLAVAAAAQTPIPFVTLVPAGEITAATTIPAASAESTPPATSTPVASAVQNPAPAPPALIDSIKQGIFSRAPQVILEETAAALLAASTTPGAGAGAPDANANAAAVTALQQSVATGQWPEVGAFLQKHFADQPELARQAYLHILDSLAADPRQQQMQQMQQAQQQSAAAGTPAPAMPMMTPEAAAGGGPPIPAFRQSQLIHPSDVLALADLCPGELDQPVLDKLAVLLRSALERGERPEAMLDQLDTGTLRLGGPTPPARLLAARFLLASGQAVAMGQFLPTLEEAQASADADRLNLLTLHFLARHQAEGQPVWLERAWTASQHVVATPGTSAPARQQALRHALALAPRVQSTLGEKWLMESFTTEPARGLEIVSTIGAIMARDRQHFQADVRQANLELQYRVVSTLLRAAPDRAAEWSEPLTVLALNWQQEARWSQERDLSSQRGPQMQYDPFGNVYFSNLSPEQQMQQQQQRGPGAIPSGRLLDLRPDGLWLDRIEPSLRPAVMAQTIELFLKVNEPEAAFPLIEQVASSLKAEGARLAGRFLEVWTEKNDPNSAKRKTNRFMYAYGYNPQADGIPLTRSRQDRNLQELGGWVKRLRALPVGSLNETMLAEAFVKTHSQAEVYRLQAMETVFGPLEGMDPSTLASLMQTMRTNLGTVWRAPKVQQDAKTNRTDKDIQAEILRGYTTALDALEPALAAHPDHWGLRLAHATVGFDQITYENSLQAASEFTARRDAVFLEFKTAAELYARALPTLEQKDQNAQVYLQWFYASLGASDLEAVKFEYPEAPKQVPLIREALLSLPGESGKKHLADFANALSTRMSAVQPELKHRYLGAGLQITGDHERARAARELFDYYNDLVTEVQLVTRLDGPDQVGTAPFGVFVEIRHTKQIEREGGGFQKYLQNQQGGNFYNFGRPPENYREKFEEAARQAVQESFDLVSCTFHTDKIKSRGTGEDDWRITPYAYLLLKPKGPQVDAVPPLKLNLDFLDTSGFAVLPIASARIPVAATGSPAMRPASQVEIKQILDERKARDGVLALEVRATAHGLVPTLDQLLTVIPGDFELTATDDQGVQVTQLDAESEENSALSERLWNLTFRARPGLPAPPTTFTFGTAKDPAYQTTLFRYADADLAEASPTVTLLESYASPGFPWRWLLAAVAAVAAVIGVRQWRKSRPTAAPPTSQFQLPDELNALNVLGLLQRIRARARLEITHQNELDQAIAELEARYFARHGVPMPDLDQLARRWVTLAG